ncbi:MAG TPA: ABC transporter permease [Candidatus Enterenecus avicola]|nr:ABC transporter permease [Candidatus Enterenecus avicola]
MKKKTNLGNRLLIGIVFFFLYAPILLLIFFSFNDANSSVIWQGFSLRWYTKLFQNQLIIQSVYNTLLVSALATIIATIVGTFSAIGLYSMRRKFRNPLMTVNSIPMMNADIVTGVAMCLFFVAVLGGWNYLAANYRFTVNLFGAVYRITFPQLSLGFGTLLIAHITFNIPYVILSVSPKLRQMDKNLVDAAQDLGCTWVQAFFKVILPEIMPGIVSGALIAFTMSVDDFVISYFTAGSATSTLAMQIYSMTKKGVTPEINAVSTILFVVVLVLLIIVNVREIRAEKAAAKRVY